MCLILNFLLKLINCRGFCEKRVINYFFLNETNIGKLQYSVTNTFVQKKRKFPTIVEGTKTERRVQCSYCINLTTVHNNTYILVK